MTHHVAYVNGAHRCYVSEDGRTRRYIGCGHVLPRSAIRHATNLDNGTPYVSPIRASGDGTTPIPSAPQPGSGQLVPSSDSRRGVAGTVRTRK